MNRLSIASIFHGLRGPEDFIFNTRDADAMMVGSSNVYVFDWPMRTPAWARSWAGVRPPFPCYGALRAARAVKIPESSFHSGKPIAPLSVRQVIKPFIVMRRSSPVVVAG